MLVFCIVILLGADSTVEKYCLIVTDTFCLCKWSKKMINAQSYGHDLTKTKTTKTKNPNKPKKKKTTKN